jgi:hypothetical protein
LPSLGIGEDNPSIALKEDEHRQSIEDFTLFRGIRVLWKIQAVDFPGIRASSRLVRFPGLQALVFQPSITLTKVYAAHKQTSIP